MNAAIARPSPRKAPKTALVMAGGTGGHIFPGLAVAEALRARGWNVHWLGAPGSMESRLVPPRGFPLEVIDFAGVRGKGLKTLALEQWAEAHAMNASSHPPEEFAFTASSDGASASIDDEDDLMI